MFAELFSQYSFTLWGLWVILFTVLVQAIVASVAHRKQSHYVPGIVDSQLSHESFVFRSHRTHQNSLDNVAVFVLPAILGIFAGMSSTTLAVFVWIYAIARLIHMVLYYVIATERNPSPRSYFYMIGFIANLGLFIALGLNGF
ncbi:MAPEG family protein [Vibrio penaeicida]|uniref:MAPEG family protein n=1 Tax=Vibrio penaeicida TaxID=104609 RepID=UPI000CEA159F|nr:MAPEG family protein [Vibrio penaeicida]